MRIRLWLVMALVLGVALPACADKRSDAKAQVDFGILVAQKGSGKTPRHAGRRPVQLDPSYAAAWNNLGIGFEQLGKIWRKRGKPMKRPSKSGQTTRSSGTTTICSGKSMTAKGRRRDR